jgi:hypothetical protein
VVRNGDDKVGLCGQQSETFLGPKRFPQGGGELFTPRSLGGQTHRPQLGVVHSQSDYRLETETIAAAKQATLLRVQEWADRSRTASAAIARRSDRRVSTAGAQPRQQAGEISKRQLAATGRTSRRSRHRTGGSQQPIDESAASPEKIRARRIG